jgi:salicylate hydroxylase
MKTHGQVGAGIQIPPNSTRLLLKLGLGPYLEKYVTEPESVLIRRWEDGKVIGRTRLFPVFREQFDAPYWVVHRAHFHEAMHELAVDLGVSIKLASKVTSYDVHHPSITLAEGSIIYSDLVIAADGTSPGQMSIGLD